MAQANAFNFQLNPQSLAQLGNVRPDYMPDVWQWQENAAQHDQVGLADLMRAAQHEKQMDPGRLQRQEADLQSVLIGNTGKTLDNEGKVLTNKKTAMENEVAEYVLPKKKEAEWRKLLTGISEEELKGAEAEVRKLLISSDPKQRAIGKQLEGGLKEALTARFQGDQQMRVQGSANAAAMSRQNDQQAHAIELEGMRTAKALAVQQLRGEVAKAKQGAGLNPKKWQELAVSLAVKLQNETDPDIKAQLNDELQFAQQMAERLAPVAPPQVDPTRVGGGKLRPGRDPMPSAPSVGKPDPLGIR